MAVPVATLRHRPPAPGAAPAGSRRSHGALGAAAVGLAVAAGFLLVRDGAPGWQALRLLVVAALGWATWRRMARAPTPAQAATAFAAGLIGIAIGIGIGLPHLVKAGLGLTTAAGMVALVSGLVLSAGGASSLLRAAHGWRRFVLLPSLVVASSVVLWSLGPALAATNVPRPELGARTPADDGLVYEDVRFDSADGVSLAGWYVPSRNGAAVVLVHGAGSTRSSVVDHAVVLARSGYGILLFDARGHGQSDGRAMDFGWYGDEDLAGAVTYLRTRPDVDPRRIGAVGMSMGAEEAIGAAGADRRIRAVVAEGATTRTAADKGWLSDEYGLRGWLQEQVDRLATATVDLLTSADPPVALREAVVAAAPRPVLVIAAGKVSDEGHAGRYLQEASPTSVELWVAPGTGHTDALHSHPREWEERVTAFLDEALMGDGR